MPKATPKEENAAFVIALNWLRFADEVIADKGFPLTLRESMKTCIQRQYEQGCLKDSAWNTASNARIARLAHATAVEELVDGRYPLVLAHFKAQANNP